jgi:hypothetical protein
VPEGKPEDSSTERCDACGRNQCKGHRVDLAFFQAFASRAFAGAPDLSKGGQIRREQSDARDSEHERSNSGTTSCMSIRNGASSDRKEAHVDHVLLGRARRHVERTLHGPVAVGTHFDDAATDLNTTAVGKHSKRPSVDEHLGADRETTDPEPGAGTQA